MNPLLLVAQREFRQITSTRSFWIMLLLFPAIFGISQAVSRFMRPEPGVAYVVVDETGAYAPLIRHRIAVAHDRDVLDSLAAYADRWKVKPTGGQAVWGGGRRLFTEADIAAFEAAGGVKEAQAQIARAKPKAAPGFRPPAEDYIAIDPPAGVVTSQGADRFGETLAPHLTSDISTPAGPRPLALAVYIPKDFGPGGQPVRMWTNGHPESELIELVRGELNQVLRLKALQGAGVDLRALAQAQGVTAPVSLTVPHAGSGHEQVVLRSVLPIGFSYVLVIALMFTGQWLLQGLVEERSNKLIEAVLACVTPEDLLYGKLLGVIAVALMMIATWIGFAFAAAYVWQSDIGDYLKPILSSVSSPWIVLALVYYFVAGYLCISMLFLAIGAVSDSMRDAQGYLMPVMFAIILPSFFMMGILLQHPDALLPRILSWIPIYTPTVMMARIGTGVPLWEVLATGVLLAAFIVVEGIAVAGIFRRNLLLAGQRMTLANLLRMFQPEPV